MKTEIWFRRWNETLPEVPFPPTTRDQLLTVSETIRQLEHSIYHKHPDEKTREHIAARLESLRELREDLLDLVDTFKSQTPRVPKTPQPKRVDVILPKPVKPQIPDWLKPQKPSTDGIPQWVLDAKIRKAK